MTDIDSILDPVLTFSEVLEHLKISRNTLLKYIKTGKIRALKFGSHWRFRREWIEDFLEKGTKENA